MACKQAAQAAEITTAKVMTHPLRVHILLQIAEKGKLSPSEYSKQNDESLNLVAYHTKVLLDYEAIEEVDRRPRRGATEHFYGVANDSPVAQALLGGLCGGMSEGGPGGIIGTLLGGRGERLIPGMAVAEVDSRGVEELRNVIEELLPDAVRQVEEKSAARLVTSGSDPTLFHIAVNAFTWDKSRGGKRTGAK
jgi:DNA-binding transcriptional ArsR family regulator